MENDSQAGDVTVPRIHPETAVPPAEVDLGTQVTFAPTKISRWRRALQVGVALGVASGVGVGVAALASAATSTTNPSGSSAPKANTHNAQGHHFMGGRGFGGFGFPGGGFAGAGFGGFGPVVHGEATVKGPNGYETIEVQSGTVTSVKDVSGSTWSLVVTGADKTALTYTVDSGTSVNGGESGIATVKSGDAVSIVAVVSKGTATAKTVIDSTRLKANRTSWAPMPQGPPSGAPAPTSSGSSTS
jgi:hypothetical protein